MFYFLLNRQVFGTLKIRTLGESFGDIGDSALVVLVLLSSLELESIYQYLGKIPSSY